MKIYEAFRQALKEFEITANKASEICGVTQGFMSLFLSGKRSTPVENLDDWLDKLDAKYGGIKRFFYSLLYDSSEVNERVDWRILINSATPEDVSKILNFLSRRYDLLRNSREISENTEERDHQIAV